MQSGLATPTHNSILWDGSPEPSTVANAVGSGDPTHNSILWDGSPEPSTMADAVGSATRPTIRFCGTARQSRLPWPMQSGQRPDPQFDSVGRLARAVYRGRCSRVWRPDPQFDSVGRLARAVYHGRCSRVSDQTYTHSVGRFARTVYRGRCSRVWRPDPQFDSVGIEDYGLILDSPSSIFHRPLFPSPTARSFPRTSSAAHPLPGGAGTAAPSLRRRGRVVVLPAVRGSRP